MKMKIFNHSWSIDFGTLEDEINAFLGTLQPGAVKFVQTSASATRTGDSDQMETDYIITVWYE